MGAEAIRGNAGNVGPLQLEARNKQGGKGTVEVDLQSRVAISRNLRLNDIKQALAQKGFGVVPGSLQMLKDGSWKMDVVKLAPPTEQEQAEINEWAEKMGIAPKPEENQPPKVAQSSNKPIKTLMFEEI